jgi:uncharacterized protein (TIGR02118 family)
VEDAVLELIALGMDAKRGREVAERLGGVSYGADDGAPPDLPFRSLVRTVTSDLDALVPAAEVGCYLAFRRVMRAESVATTPGRPIRGVVGIFGLHRNPVLSHGEADAHWRDTHAPLALKHHPGMCDYLQCSVVQVFAGPAYDGFAFCKFSDERDMRERFFDSDAGREIILSDVAKFADTERSPRVVRADHWDFPIP